MPNTTGFSDKLSPELFKVSISNKGCDIVTLFADGPSEDVQVFIFSVESCSAHGYSLIVVQWDRSHTL